MWGSYSSPCGPFPKRIRKKGEWWAMGGDRGVGGGMEFGGRAPSGKVDKI